MIPDEEEPQEKRRKHYIKCEVCKARLPKYLLGKHLISHYHYTRISMNPQRSLELILENIDKIVRQSPFQCQPCKFYANSEEDFMRHWNSYDHRDVTERPGKFWCSFCKFECEDNNQMRRHLLGTEHGDVIMAINRSVPIIISKHIPITCKSCERTFRYNFELINHTQNHLCTTSGTATEEYQSKFSCEVCGEIWKTRTALQRHQHVTHKINKFFCSFCKIEFSSAEEAKTHRNSAEHKKILLTLRKSTPSSEKKCPHCKKDFPNILILRSHIDEQHSNEKPCCSLCAQTFTLAQDLSRHVRDKVCQKEVTTSTSIEVFDSSTSTSELPITQDIWCCDVCAFT